MIEPPDRFPPPSPVYITSLELENVRCFGNRQVLSLGDEKNNPTQWNIILGDNGVGKTTLLQCLAWMRPVPADPTKKSVEPALTTGKSVEPALTGEENTALESLIRIGDNVSVCLTAKFSIGASLDSSFNEANSTVVNTEFKMQGKNGHLEKTEPSIFDIDQLSVKPPNDISIFCYGAARRPGTVKSEKSEILDPIVSLFDNEAALYDAEDILIKLHHRAAIGKREGDKRRLLQVKQVIADILPDISVADDIEILGPTVIGDPDEPSGVRFNTPYGSVPLSALSLGYQTTLTWVLDLALQLYGRYPDHSDPLSGPGIVLIDNIDLHLHPLWQRHLMEDLSGWFKAIQFVATAHSPLIVQAAENASVAVLQEISGEVVISTHPGSVKDWRADQILASDLFDVPARSAIVEKLRKERDALLDKLDRNEEQQDRLGVLEERLNALPTGESIADQEAMALIRSVAEELKDEVTDQE